jgi:hypothetical protein
LSLLSGVLVACAALPLARESEPNRTVIDFAAIFLESLASSAADLEKP